MRWSLLLLFYSGFFFAAGADVTVVQSIQPVRPGGVLEEAREMTVYLAAGKLRLDSGDVSSIIRTDKKMTYSILHLDKMFVAMPHGERSRALGMDTPLDDAEPLKAKPTGKSDRINGFNCVEVEVEQSDGTTLDAWLTRDSEAVKALESLKAWQSGEYAPVLAGMGLGHRKTLPGMEGMPVRTTVLGPDRKPTVRVEVMRLSNAAIRTELFEPPAGYREFSPEELNAITTPPSSADLERHMKELDSSGEASRKPDAKP